MQLRSSLCFVVHWSKWCSTFEEISTIPSFISKYLALWYQTLQPGRLCHHSGKYSQAMGSMMVLRLLSSVYIHSTIAGSFWWFCCSSAWIDITCKLLPWCYFMVYLCTHRKSNLLVGVNRRYLQRPCEFLTTNRAMLYMTSANAEIGLGFTLIFLILT